MKTQMECLFCWRTLKYPDDFPNPNKLKCKECDEVDKQRGINEIQNAFQSMKIQLILHFPFFLWFYGGFVSAIFVGAVLKLVFGVNLCD